jgi:phosphoribosylcarboxyaminoimidazole (NCAIR) mutase
LTIDVKACLLAMQLIPVGASLLAMQLIPVGASLLAMQLLTLTDPSLAGKLLQKIHRLQASSYIRVIACRQAPTKSLLLAGQRPH